MANDIKSAELCLNAVQALENQLRGARKTLINSETCIVNRGRKGGSTVAACICNALLYQL